MSSLQLDAFGYEPAARSRDEGIARAVAHADRVDPHWSQRAYGLALAYISTCPAKFTCEDVREFADQARFPSPPDKRAWGAVMARLARQRVIIHVGYTSLRAAHCNRGPSKQWVRAA